MWFEIPVLMGAVQLSELGFDGYALDYVNCPDGLRWYLERELNMHRVVRDLRFLVFYIA